MRTSNPPSASTWARAAAREASSVVELDEAGAEFVGGGPSFTLSPPSQKSGALVRFGIHGGDKYTDIAFEAGADERGSYRGFSGRFVARFRF